MSRKRILVVEDEVLIRLDIQATLEELDHEVVAVPTVKEAMTALARGGVDVAILDYHVEDGDTTELAQHLRGIGVPFIVCSGSAGWAELGEVFAGAGFLAKPYSTDSLLAAVSGAASSNNLN